MKQGGEHWQWSPETPFYIGVLPRRGAKSSDVKVGILCQHYIFELRDFDLFCSGFAIETLSPGTPQMPMNTMAELLSI